MLLVRLASMCFSDSHTNLVCARMGAFFIAHTNGKQERIQRGEGFLMRGDAAPRKRAAAMRLSCLELVLHPLNSLRQIGKYS